VGENTRDLAARADQRARGGTTVGAIPILGVGGVLARERIGSGTPTAGQYVDGGTGAWTSRPLLIAGATVDLTLGTVAADIAGATTTATVVGTTDVFLVHAVFDFDVTTASAGVLAIGELVVDGTAKAVQSVQGMTTLNRSTVSQQWRITGITAGARIFKLRAFKTAVGGACVARATQTTITVLGVS